MNAEEDFTLLMNLRKSMIIFWELCYQLWHSFFSTFIDCVPWIILRKPVICILGQRC